MIQRMFVTIDTKKTNYKNVGKINHGDDLILELTVLSDGDIISFNNPMVDLLVKKSDGKMIRQNSGIEHIKPNKFIIEVSKDCVTSTGLSTNQLIINDNGRISTCMFYYTILSSLEEDIIESVSNVEVLEQLDEFTIQMKDKMENFDSELQNRMSELEDAIDDLVESFGATSVELQEVELSRNEAEQTRAQAESVRVQNESRRLQNDLDLANAEAERVRAENVRIQNEDDRALADAVMDQKESEREDSELERIQNESKRATNEEVRQQNENTRQSNESVRISNETDRKTQENRRVTAETNRVNAETTRRNNENSRISNEIERQKAMNEMKSLIYDANGFDERVGVVENEIGEINSSLETIENELELYNTKIKYSHITLAGQNYCVVEKNRITFFGLTMYAISKTGAAVKEYYWAIKQTYVMSENQILLWNWDTNKIQIVGNNDARPKEFVVLLMYKGNRFVAGELLPILYTNIFNVESIDCNGETRCKIIDNVDASQGMTMCNDKIYVAYGSWSDHLNKANICVYDNKFNKLGNITHNLGHMATIDYNISNDTLIAGNGESSTTVLPRIDLIKNFSTYNVGDDIVFGSSNITSIEFFKGSKKIGGSGACACFGESPNIAYMITGQDIPHRIFKLLLGMGTNDLSDKTSDNSDLMSWGTFISGKGDDEYNGTAKILQTFYGYEFGISQGMCYHDGFLFYAVTDYEKTCKILQLKLTNDPIGEQYPGKFKLVKQFKIPNMKLDGTRNNLESEGCCIYNGLYLACGVKSITDYTMKLALFPLYNEQGGSGRTGEKINFDFITNSTPQIFITPTANVTDIYVSHIDNTGFIVSSVSGGSGTFNWKCKIS